MSVTDVVVLVVVAALIFAVVRYLTKKSKTGGCVGCDACGGGSCPSCGPQKKH